ncbi:hypothetical protein [Nibrella viscosa]|uniref:hypothetical protein n=1 Tax=Nibrella viscosa TaxID=1084524 RepID=UPI0031ED5B55
MKKILIGSLVLSMMLTTRSIAQTKSSPSLKTTSGVTSNTVPENETSSVRGMNRVGSGNSEVGSGKMKGETVTSSGNSYYSPTGPTSSQGNEYVIVAPSDNISNNPARPNPSIEPEPQWVNRLPATGPRVRTQGSSSEGTASAPTPGGAPGTNTKITVRQQPSLSTSTLSTSGQSGSTRPGSVSGVRD